MINRQRAGFTLIEILVIISVIAILSAIGVISYITLQQNARNSQRSVKATLIAENLEKYYDNNGEYPGCAAVTAASSIVKQNTLKGISEETLRAPKAADGVTNSITCQSIESLPNSDAFSYTGDTKSACLTGPACEKWQLQYREEGSGKIVSISSRREAHNLTIDAPVLTATATGSTSISASWNAIEDATSYELQRSLTPGFASITTTTHSTTSTSIGGLAPGTTYYLRARAIAPYATSNWSDVVSATTTVSGPTGTIVISAAMSGMNAIGTASGGTCASGSTIQYQIRYHSTSVAADGTWSSYTVGTPRTVGAWEGNKYTFQAQARCITAGAQSGYITSGTAQTIAPINAPTGTLTITATMSGTNARGTAGGGTCASGTTIERQVRYNTNSGTWVAWTTGTPRDVASTPGTLYTFQQQARCITYYAQSSYAQSGTAGVTPAVNAPTGTLTITATMSGTNARGTAGGGTCASGTTIERQIRYFTNTGSYTGWTTGTPRDVAATQGYRYTFQQQARCVSGGVGSAWVQSGTAAVTRSVTAPSGLTITAAMSGTNARGTAGGGTCASGTTIERQIRYQSTNTSTAGSWSSYTTGTPRNVAASQGYRYTFQQQARCVGQNANSGYATSSSANVVRAINAPSAPSVSASTSGSNTTYSRNNVSCPTGTTTRYQYKYLADWNYDSGWNGPTTGAASLTWGTASQGYQYRVQMQAQCYTVHATSGWSGTGTGSYIRPVSPPGAISYRISREGTNNEAHLYATSSCHSSVGLYSRADVHTWDYRWLDVSAYGWYANSHGGTWTLHNWNYYGNSVHTGATNGSRGPYSSGSRWNIATDMMCRNSQTGRASASTGRRESGILYLP